MEKLDPLSAKELKKFSHYLYNENGGQEIINVFNSNITYQEMEEMFPNMVISLILMNKGSPSACIYAAYLSGIELGRYYERRRIELQELEKINKG